MIWKVSVHYSNKLMPNSNTDWNRGAGEFSGLSYLVVSYILWECYYIFSKSAPHFNLPFKGLSHKYKSVAFSFQFVRLQSNMFWSQNLVLVTGAIVAPSDIPSQPVPIVQTAHHSSSISTNSSQVLSHWMNMLRCNFFKHQSLQK